ncbi:MAG TPA: flavin-dependent monooxygenase [Alphaproteobacteria bacterium]|nr:flavin-dependent monooxygenase [Alphaproteobacteria bacterium]HBA41956.1 flavin-dependent monooxygenase [Alphaproteobacteria bacterium]
MTQRTGGGSVPGGEELVARARDMVPVLRARAAECEALRRVPDATIEDFRKAGFFKIVHPAKYGGYELPPTVFFDVCAEIGRGCASSAWVFGIVGIHNWQIGLFPPQAAEDVWGEDPDVLISSSYAPTGKAERVEGGFRLSGRWSFSTGCDHCNWLFVGGIVDNGRGGRDMMTFLVPRPDYEIDDNWHVAGLAGTGSKDFVIADAFVPDHRTHSMVDAFRIDNPGQEMFPGDLFKYPFGQMFANAIAAPPIGAATAMLELFCDYTKQRGNALGGVTGGSSYAQDPTIQMRVAEADALIRGARLRMRDNFNRMGEFIAAGQAIPLPLRVQARWDAAHITKSCLQAADLIMEAAGGHSLHLDNPLQRFFRDIHAMRAHALNTPEPAGKNLGGFKLGLDNAEIFI